MGKEYEHFDDVLWAGATATADFYLANSCADGIPMWDTGAPNLHRLPANYLTKPADAEAIDAALASFDKPLPPPPEHPMSADRVRWEHIQRVYELCNRNVSETARRLNMHRRTLQRILAKRAPK